MTSSMGGGKGLSNEVFSLRNPQTIAVFDTYESAQKAVDFLSDQKFPVGQLAIIGTDLRMVERVVGRRTYGTVAWQGGMNGVTFGLLIAVVLLLTTPELGALNAMLFGILSGIFFGILFAVISHMMSRGKRDFDSLTRIVPSHFEVLAEARVAGRAKQMLAQADRIAKGLLPENLQQGQSPIRPAEPTDSGHPAGDPASPAPDSPQLGAQAPDSDFESTPNYPDLDRPGFRPKRRQETPGEDDFSSFPPFGPTDTFDPRPPESRDDSENRDSSERPEQ